MARLPYRTREDLELADQGTYDNIAATRGRVANAFSLLLNSPRAASAVAALGEYLRFESEVPPDIREIAALIAARKARNEYEWLHHIVAARRTGMEPEVVESIGRDQPLVGLPPEQQVPAQAASELVATGTLSDDAFHGVLTQLGSRNTVDLIVLVGYYTMLCMTLNALEVDLEEDFERAR